MKRLVTRSNTRFKVSEKVTVLLLVMVLVAVVNIGVIYSYHQQVEDAGNSVNVAGQQRMLSQRMVWFASDIASGERPDEAREGLRIAMERYDRNLHALRFGGTVTDTQLTKGGNDSATSVVLRGESLQRPPAAAEDELATEADVWADYEPHVRTVLREDPDSPAFQTSLAYMRQHSNALLSVSDAATAEMAAAIRVKRQALQQMLIVLLGVDLLVALLGSMFARRYLGTPMAEMATKGLALAGGDLTTDHGDDLPIDRSVPRADQRAELARVSRSFDEVQSYLQTVTGQAQALANREFDAPIFDETVPGELGDSLETMHDDLQAYIHDLQTTTEKLDAIIAASPAAIYITDTEGVIQRWNPAAREIFGWDETAVLGERNPTIPSDEREEYRALRSRVVAGEALTGVERRRVTKSGEEIDVSLSTATVRGPDGGIDGIMTVAEDISDRKERERLLRRQRDELESLGRVSDLLLESTRELVESAEEDRIEDLVCERLVDADRYTAASIGDVRGDEFVVRTARGGNPEERLVEGERRAVVRAFETGETRVANGGEGAPSQRESGDDGHFAAIPLSHRGTVHGVLTVRTGSEYAFSDREIAGLETLGKTIGFARNAITNKKLLFADTVVELRFSVQNSDGPFVATSDRLGCDVTLDGLVVATADDAVTLYLEVEGTTAEAFVAALDDDPEIVDAWVVADEPNHVRIGARLDADSPLGKLAHYEVTLQDVDLASGTGEYGFEAPLSVDIGSVVDDVREWYPAVELTAKRERDRPVTTAAEVATAMESELTDRQYEIFQTAYFGGYFEWPRDNTIEDLAETLDISGATFHHHLRHAQRKLAAALLDTDDSE